MTAPEPKPGILDILAYTGGNVDLTEARRVINLASNENALGPGPRALAAYREAGGRLERYPDGAALALRQAIAEVNGLDAARIVCGAGSDELLALLARAYAGPGDEVVHSAHGFLMYAIAAKAAGAAPISVPERALVADVDAILTAVGPRTRIVFLANPNNPTGACLPRAEVARLHRGLPRETLLVLDAAYAEYVGDSDYEAGAALVDGHDNVVMTRTFSKIYGLAALRVGWAYAPAAVADILNRLRGPFNVSAPALEAATAAVRDTAHKAAVKAHNDAMLPWFSDALEDLGLGVNPSAGNFVLVRFPDTPAHNAAAALKALREESIWVRGMAAYGLDAWLRITIGRREELEACLAALGRFLAAPERP